MKIKHRTPYAPLRRGAYPQFGDQLDAILEMAKALKEQGIMLPEKTLAWIEQCEQVKSKFKKN